MTRLVFELSKPNEKQNLYVYIISAFMFYEPLKMNWQIVWKLENDFRHCHMAYIFKFRNEVEIMKTYFNAWSISER